MDKDFIAENPIVTFLRSQRAQQTNFVAALFYLQPSQSHTSRLTSTKAIYCLHKNMVRSLVVDVDVDVDVAVDVDVDVAVAVDVDVDVDVGCF